MNLISIVDNAKDAFYALTSCCCATATVLHCSYNAASCVDSCLYRLQPVNSYLTHFANGILDATLRLNGRSFKIAKLLGEGGFSYVYLAQDSSSGRLFALKKIRCPLGADSLRAALKEADAYKRFRHPNIIRCLDSCVVQDMEGEGKIVYLFLPYYKNGTVQHVINANAVNGSRYQEREMLQVFLGTCSAVQAMHSFKFESSESYPPSSISRDVDSTLDVKSNEGRRTGANVKEEAEDYEEETISTRETEEGEALIGSLEGAKVELEEEEGTRRLAGMGEDGGIIQSRLKSRGATTKGPHPWAHRDIKPANIMLADDGHTAILMDFGSAVPARITVPTRQIALTEQDIAAEHCSMPFRAPELFDVKTGVDLTEAVDIWSLGCTLYAMAYGTSPFETSQQSEHGGSIAMAVLNGKYAFPEQDAGYSQNFRELIKMMLKLKAEERPAIDEVISATKHAIARLE